MTVVEYRAQSKSRTLRSKEPGSDYNCTTVAACFVLLLVLQLLACAAFLVAWLLAWLQLANPFAENSNELPTRKYYR